jgi:hypothetical protein
MAQHFLGLMVFPPRELVLLLQQSEFSWSKDQNQIQITT